MWIYLGLLSALFLGFYNIAKKLSVNENAVIPVLFCSTGVGVIVVAPIVALSILLPEQMQNIELYTPAISFSAHCYIFLKSAIVGTAWTLGYFALKHLPITIVQPIRASSIIVTIFGALIIYQEAPPLMQWIGVAIIISSYFALSLLGKKEGIIFHKDKWIFFMVLATILGAISGLYDKYLITRQNFTPITLLVWFSVYLFVFYLVITALLWYPRRAQTTPFRWHWAIPCISILLLLADLVYFTAIDHGANLAVLAPLRRSNVVIAFVAGAIIFKEKNRRQKGVALLGVIIGVIIIAMSK